MTNNLDTRQLIYDVLHDTGMTQTELERQSGIGKGQVSNLLARPRNVSLSTIQKIAEVGGYRIVMEKEGK